MTPPRRTPRRPRVFLAALLAATLARPAAAAGPLGPGETVDLNRASAEDLLRVPGMDERTAGKILYLRQQLGSIQSIEQLLAIPGLTPDRLAAMKDHLSLAGAPPAAEASAWDEDALADNDEGTSLDTAVTGDDDAFQQFRDEPLDLNRAKEEEFRQLPGVDRPLARRIVRERARVKKFLSVDDLKKVPGLDPATLEGFRPYVMVKAPKKREALVAGDTRVRMRSVQPRSATLLAASPRFQNSAYLYDRARFRFGEQSQAGWLAKRASVGAAVTPENVQRLYTLKFSVQETDVAGFDRIVLGNYALSHGQGLIFYDGLGEFVRPAKVKGRGSKPDFSSGSNDYHKGAVLTRRLGALDLEVFTSQKELDLPLNPANGTVNADINMLREMLGDLQDEEALADNDTVTERLYGGRAAFPVGENVHVGFTGYESRYNHVFDPTQTGYSFAHVFRGDKNVIGGADFDAYYRSLNLYGEAARSISSGAGVATKDGEAWTVTPMLRLTPYTLWASFFDYDADFFTRHGKGVSYAIVGSPEELTKNQKGVMFGLEYQGSRYSNRTNYYLATFPTPLGDGNGSDPVQASHGRQVYFENQVKPVRPIELYYRWQLSEQDSFPVQEVDGSNGDVRRQQPKLTQKHRYQVTWTASSKVRYRVRYETRYEDLPDTGVRDFGYLLMGDVKWKPKKGLTLNARWYYFDSPAASLTTGVEEIWSGVVYYRLAGSLNNLRGTPGTRFYLVAKQAVGRDLDVWFKYDVNRRPGDLTTIQTSQSAQESKALGAVRQGFHVQVDYKWGGRGRMTDEPDAMVVPADWFEAQ